MGVTVKVSVSRPTVGVTVAELIEGMELPMATAAEPGTEVARPSVAGT